MENYFVKLTENRQNGYVGAINCTGKQLNELENLQDAGSFQRFHIDILDTGKRPGTKDKKARQNFFENIKLFEQ